MSSSPFNLPATRREFLRRSASGLGLIAFSQVAPAFLTRSVAAGLPAAERDRSILVLVQLAGGNDGLNTVVPCDDDNYHRLRPNLALPRRELHLLGDNLGLHPACTEMAALHKEGKLGIIRNVGYPNPNRSHFRSMEIWETASDSDAYLNTGWLGRFFDNACGGCPREDPLALNIGNEMPDVFLAEREHNIHSLQGSRRERSLVGDSMVKALAEDTSPGGSNAGFLRHTLMNTLVTERRVLSRLHDYKPMVEYPGSALARSLRSIAGLIAAGLETRVYFVSLGGFDTHANQPFRHRQLLRQLSSSLAAFQTDLQAHRLDGQVLTMTFSEFGRRPAENASRGTDHGTAAPLFVMGSRLNGSLHGSPPDLDVGRKEDLTHSTDFRSVYATVIRRWFGADPAPVLGRGFSPLGFI